MNFKQQLPSHKKAVSVEKEKFYISSTKNKNMKSFNFDIPSKNSLNKKSKKLLNMTGTLPKGLLSPTNNSKKHQHAEYFESATTVENQLENTAPIIFSQKRNQQTNAGSTVININIENSGCHHSPFINSQQTVLYPTINSVPSTHINGSYKTISSNVNQTNKQERRPQSMSSNDSCQNQYQVQKQDNQQTKKIMHQKAATVPNSAVFILNDNLNKGAKFQKTQTVKQTPRQVNQSEEIKKRKNSTIKSNNKSAIYEKKSYYLTDLGVDFNEIQVGLDQDTTQSSKLKTQKLNNLLKEVICEQNKFEKTQKRERSKNNNEKQNQLQNISIPVSLSPKTGITMNDKYQTEVLQTQQSQGQCKKLQNSTNINEEIKYPITAAKALKHFMSYMTDFEKGEILDYKEIYFIGLNAKKIKGSPLHPYNYGYDDERGDYKVVLKDHIGFRYEILEFLGKGSFGQALKCLDHKTNELVAVKLIRNKKKFQHQAGVELNILQYLKKNDPDDAFNIIRIKDYAIFRKHLVISFELFSINLYEFIKNNNFQGVTLSLIRRFAIQILQALKFLSDQNIIHCDLKPENILLKSPDKSGIKIIDFGSSCFSDQRIYTYIQSRFYRAPEIILGIPYTTAIDMWSFGCILCELFTGFPIFPGETEQEQLAIIMEIKGLPSKRILDQSTRKNIFFDDEDKPLPVMNSRGKLRMPNSKSLEGVLLQNESQSFTNFLERCLDWDPSTRITPFDALQHDWIIEGLPPKVLLHHQRMLGFIPNNDQSYQPQLSVKNVYKNDISQKQVEINKNKTVNESCLLSDNLQSRENHNFIRGKSLNKTGIIVLDANEDLADVDQPPSFLKKTDQKSNTSNLADIIHEINKNKKSKVFEQTQICNKTGNKASFLSQNKNQSANFFNHGEEEEEDQDNEITPYDERAQIQFDKQKKKNKIPFSFLMHHYNKTKGEQNYPTKNLQVGFFQPGQDVKINNFMGGLNNAQAYNQHKKGNLNYSSNI